MQPEPPSKGRRFRKLLGIVTVAAILCTTGLYWFRGAPFDRAAWLDDAQIQQGVRLKMADRLVARRTLEGMSRSQVVALLGSPPRQEYFPEYELVYWLGRERKPLFSFMFISIDSEWLAVKFGDNQRVSKAKILRD
jgi:outer membrane protein assembly factor BamE (lipoprotein component of BamABCDE complex)